MRKRFREVISLDGAEELSLLRQSGLLSREEGCTMYPYNKYYFSPEKILLLSDCEEVDVLCDDGLHYLALVHKPTNKPPFLSFKNYSKMYNYHHDLTVLCMTDKGRYSSNDGVDGAKNEKKSQHIATRVFARNELPDNVYLTVDEISNLRDGAQLEALCTDRKHYYVEYHTAKNHINAYLHFPNWSKSHDVDNNISDTCLALRGTYSSTDGLDTKNNRYKRRKYNSLESKVYDFKDLYPQNRSYRSKSRSEIFRGHYIFRSTDSVSSLNIPSVNSVTDDFATSGGICI
jgi:hypothetical protein